MRHKRVMLNLFHILTQTCLITCSEASSTPDIPECVGYDGQYPDDSVHCRGFSANNLKCTNYKECCKTSSSQGKTCFNMSVLEEKGLWTRPKTTITPIVHTPSCSWKDVFKSQVNNTNKAIDGHVIVQHKVVSFIQCSDFCLREPRCRGFNVAIAGSSEGKKVCELLKNDGNIIDRLGFRFWFFDRMSYEKAYLMPRCST